MSRRAWTRADGRAWGFLTLALGLVFAAPASTGAHPHVFIDYSVALILAGESLQGIRMTWTFDELFSGMILQEFDGDRDRTLSPKEVQKIETKHLPEFRASGFFTTVSVNGKAVPVKEARDFQATVAKGQVTYQFILPVQVGLGSVSTLEVVGDDPVFFIQYTALGVNPEKQASGPFGIDCRVARDKTGAVPDAVRCAVKRR